MRRLLYIADTIGNIVLFQGSIHKAVFAGKISWHRVSEEMWRVFVLSVPTTILSGFFVGAIMTIQFTMQSKEFGAMGYLGGLATSGTVREVGPLLIAFMLSARIGAYTSAELGMMNQTEQIDSMRCLGVNPLYRIVAPRYVAIIFASYFLLVAGIAFSILGGITTGILFSGISIEEYIRHIPSVVAISSVMGGFFKCLIFAIVMASICTYHGYNGDKGSEGVGRSVINTAVHSMFAMVVFDWITSHIWTSLCQLLEGM